MITLGIIGVVAALTLPTLMSKIRNKQYQVAYRKAYSTLNQALKSANEDGEIVSLASGGFNSSGGINTGSGVVGKNFKVLASYFAGATGCFNQNADKCWACDNGEAGRGSRGCDKSNYAFMDASGMGYYLYNNDEWPILVDVNGFSGPNVLGRDRYVMYFTNSFTKSRYPTDVDAILPWKDIKTKQRWCPSGDCPNSSRLFGHSTGNLDYDIDAGKK